MQSNQLLPTRSALLELSDERNIVAEAYDFLDEKRLLLAAELLKQLDQYEKLLDEYEQLRQQAHIGLAAMVNRHGLQGTQVYPANQFEAAGIDKSQRRFMGVTLVTSELVENTPPRHRAANNPSPEAEQVRKRFLQLTHKAAVLAGASGNVYRLFEEYRRTERRARALENVVIPEIEQALREMTNQLEELDQEDIIRMHLKHAASN